MLSSTFRYIIDLASAVLAILSMQVKVEFLSDGKYVMAIVYTRAIVRTLIFIMLVMTEPCTNTKSVFTSIAILAPTVL